MERALTCGTVKAERSMRICYMSWISKCRADWDLGLWTTSGLAFGKPQRNGKIRFVLRRNTFFSRKSPLRSGSPNASPDVVHRPRSQSLLHFDIRNIQQIRTQNWFPIASRMTSAPSPSALADRSDLPVLLITRLSKADKINRRGRSPLPNSVTCGNRNETLKYPGRFHRDTERYFRKTRTIFEKNRFRKVWSIINRLYNIPMFDEVPE